MHAYVLVGDAQWAQTASYIWLACWLQFLHVPLDLPDAGWAGSLSAIGTLLLQFG